MKKINIKKISLIGIIMSLLIIFIVFVRIPTIFGYIHFGDSLIFLSAIMGLSEGFFIGSIGTVISDIITGYPMFAIASFIIHGLQGLLFAFIYKKKILKETPMFIFFSTFLIGIITVVFGYYFAEVFFYGNFIVPLFVVVPNILQVLISSFITSILFNSIKTLFTKIL